jgi:hypothetical protein
MMIYPLSENGRALKNGAALGNDMLDRPADFSRS